MKKSFVIILLLFTLGIVPGFTQRIMGYFPTYRTAELPNIQFNKMTDVVFAFLNFNATTGALDMTNAAVLTNLITTARAKNPAIRIHISTGGGAFGTAAFNTLTANAGARATFVAAMANLIQTNNLDGWDLDWEYPNTTAEKNNHQLLIHEMKVALEAKEALMCKTLEVSAAVGAIFGTADPATNHINMAAIADLDNVLIMAYDGGSAVIGAPHHSSLAFAQSALDGWNAAGVPYSKMLLGVPFYGWTTGFGAASTYAALSAMNPATVFNADLYNGYYYNGAPTLRSKVDLTRRAGKIAQGIMIWEVGQDVLTGTYSLLNAIYQHMLTNYGFGVSFPNPCTLPVDWLQFNGEAKSDHVQLQWSVANSRNNEKYVIERSEDGNSFTEIAEINADENPETLHYYEYKDFLPAINGKKYYRIRQQDSDGQYSFSNIIQVFLKKENGIFWTLNNGVISVTDNNAHIGVSSYALYDVSGSIIHQHTSTSENAPVQWEYKSLKPGIYFLKSEDGVEQRIEKIIVY